MSDESTLNPFLKCESIQLSRSSVLFPKYLLCRGQSHVELLDGLVALYLTESSVPCLDYLDLVYDQVDGHLYHALDLSSLSRFERIRGGARLVSQNGTDRYVDPAFWSPQLFHATAMDIYSGIATISDRIAQLVSAEQFDIGEPPYVPYGSESDQALYREDLQLFGEFIQPTLERVAIVNPLTAVGAVDFWGEILWEVFEF